MSRGRFRSSAGILLVALLFVPGGWAEAEEEEERSATETLGKALSDARASGALRRVLGARHFVSAVGEDASDRRLLRIEVREVEDPPGLRVEVRREGATGAGVIQWTSRLELGLDGRLRTLAMRAVVHDGDPESGRVGFTAEGVVEEHELRLRSKHARGREEKQRIAWGPDHLHVDVVAFVLAPLLDPQDVQPLAMTIVTGDLEEQVAVVLSAERERILLVDRNEQAAWGAILLDPGADASQPKEVRLRSRKQPEVWKAIERERFERLLAPWRN